jgi:hypothetical protein
VLLGGAPRWSPASAYSLVGESVLDADGSVWGTVENCECDATAVYVLLDYDGAKEPTEAHIAGPPEPLAVAFDSEDGNPTAYLTFESGVLPVEFILDAPVVDD